MTKSNAPVADQDNANWLQTAQQSWRSMMSWTSNQVTPNPHPIPQQRNASVLTTQNQRTNEPWGDHMGEKPPNCTRIHIQNVNGFTLDGRGGQFDHYCTTHKEIQADISCGQEHKLDTTQMHVRSILYDTARQHWNRSKMSFGTTPIPFSSQYKPGGTFILSTGSITGRVRQQYRDKWGRWVVQEFSRSHFSTLMVVSAYQPVDKRSQEGTNSVSSQQRSLLLQTSDSTNDPRTAFKRDLLQQLREYRQAGNEILLVGDFNETYGADPDGIASVTSELGLTHLMSHHHPGQPPPVTYARGVKCLDYAFGTQKVTEAIMAAGYEAFNERFISDHRGYFLDLNNTILFGSPTQELASPSKRRLTTSNLKNTTTYIEKAYELMQAHNVFNRAERLTYAGERHQLAEALDRDVTAACLSAESKLPVFGEAAWSQELAMARKRTYTLGKLLSNMKSGRETTPIITEASEIMPSTWSPPTSILQCSQQWRAAKKSSADIASNSIERRDKEMKERIRYLDQAGTTGDRETATILRRLKKAEDLKQLWKKLKAVRSKDKSQGVVRLEIPQDETIDPKKCNDWQIVDIPTEIVRHLQQRNRNHFGQAHGTPFTIPPLSDHLGFSGDGEAALEMLNGTYDAGTLDESVQLLISHLKYINGIAADTCRPTITDAEFCGKLRVWRESTSTSPSGLHLGHYKALVAKHSFTTNAHDSDLTEEFINRRDEINRKQEALRRVRLSLINYALERGYSYKRWQDIVNSVLFKDPDNVRLHRTRIIHIYEADFNLAMGLKWRVATQQAEDLKALNDGQYGSRTSRSAIEPVYIEELQCEISRATRKPLVLTNYDATSCYDRIVPNLGMVVSQKYGVHASVTKATAETLRLATYKVRTELGISEAGYSHTDDLPIYGTGQGSTFSGQTWNFLSSTAIDCYDTKATPATYSNPDGTVKVTVGIAGFVDDCNGQTNRFEEDGSNATTTKVLNQAQANAQIWTNLLSATGGALEVSKCSCHVMQYKFTVQGAPSLVPSFPPEQVNLSVWDPNDKVTHTLQLMSVYQSHKTLGHYKEPAGHQKTQFRQLQEKSQETTSFLWTCPLTRSEAWTFYYACYLPSVGYPLACSSMTRNQLDTIQRKAMSIIIPRCGFNRKTKKEILYGPLALGGASFRPLWVQQGIGQVTLFLRQWRKDSQSGRLSRIALAWFQVQSGVSFQLLEKPTIPVPQLESKWISSMREFLAAINAKIVIADFVPPILQRLHDFVIMEVIQDSGKFTPAEIRRLNYCRLYLNAETVSDLTIVAGTHLDPSKLAGQWSLQSSKFHGNAIYQERPEGNAWTLWRKANKLWSNGQGELTQPLGDWVINSIHKHRLRQFSYCAHNYLWVRTESGYVVCEPEGGQVFRETEHIQQWDAIPSDATPMEARFIGNARWKWTTATYVMVPGIIPAGTFGEYVETLPAWEQELLVHTKLASDAYAVGVALEHGLKAVSDGSEWFQSQGSFGWMLSSDIGERLATGMGPARSSRPNSYRSEGYGMLALLVFLQRLAEFINLHGEWSGTIATDSKSLIDTIRGPNTQNPGRTSGTVYRRPLDPLSPEWDVVIGIQQLLQEMPGLKLEHIKGHQDRDCEYHRLPLLAQLNVDADALANRYQRDHGLHRPEVLLTRWAGAHLVLPSGTVTSHYEAALRYHASAEPLRAHLRNRNQWTQATFDTINWTAHGAIIRTHMKKRTHLIKLVNGILPTNANLHRNDPIRNLCPCCRNVKEDWVHIIRCDTPSRAAWRTQMIKSLDAKCESLQTEPTLRAVLITSIQSWMNWLATTPEEHFAVPTTSAMSTAITRLINKQNAIGWHHLWLGRYCQDWSEIQEAYYATMINSKEGKKRTGQRWQQSVIGEVWSQWFLLWDMRNHDLHGENASKRARAEREEVERTLRDIYDMRAQMEPSVQQLLCNDITNHFAKPLWYNKNWVAIHGPLVKTSIKRAKKKAIQGVRSIRQYFTPR
jgi:exonuclease III